MKILDPSKIQTCRKTNHMLIGIRFTVPSKNVTTMLEASDYINLFYFGEMGHYGMFRLLAESHAHLASASYIENGCPTERAAVQESFAILGDTATIDILLMQEGYDEFEDEMKSTTKELNNFIGTQYAMDWEQFDVSHGVDGENQNTGFKLTYSTALLA